MKAALLACILATFAVRSCEAQQSRAQVSASVTIVEAIGVTTGATSVTQATGPTLDVTTPLSIRGSAPRVVQVVNGEHPRPIAAQLRPACPPAGGTAESCAVRSRIPASLPSEPTILTYLVATVN